MSNVKHKTDHIPTNYVWFNGAIMPEEMRENYNYQSDRIKSFQDAGRPVPDHILNGRHNLVASFIRESNNPNWSK